MMRSSSWAQEQAVRTPTAVILEILLILAVIFGPLAFGCVELWSRAILEFLLYGMLFFRLRSARRMDIHPLHKTLLIGGACLVLIGLLQSFNPVSIAGPRGFMPFTASLYHTRQALILWGSYLALLICTPSVLERPGAPDRLGWAFVCVGFTVAAVGLWFRADTFTFVYGFRPVPFGVAAFGSYFNGGHAASMIALSLLVGLGLFVSRATGFNHYLALGGNSGGFLVLQVILFFALLTMAAAIICQGNRGTLIATAASLWLMGAFASGLVEGARSRSLRFLLLLAAAGAALAVYLSPTLFGLFKGLGENSVSHRLAMYRGGLQIWKDFPVWGIGLGSVVAVFHAYKESLVFGIVDHVHNDWLEILLETGLAGFILFGCSILLLLRMVWTRWTEAPPEERWLRAGVMAAAFGFFFHALVEFSFKNPANGALWLTLMAWLGTRHRRSEGKPPSPLPMNSRLRAVLAGVPLLLAAISLRPAISNIHRHRSITPVKAERAARLEKAYWWDPDPLLTADLARLYTRKAKSEKDPEARADLLKALGWVNKGLEADPINSYLQHNKGVVLWRLGRRRDAQSFMPLK